MSRILYPPRACDTQLAQGVSRRLAKTFGAGVVILVLTVLGAAETQASCCRITRTDSTTPTGLVRVCELNGSSDCSTVLFEGSLGLGDTRDICSTGSTVVYYEYDTTAGAYGPPIQAICNSTDIEL